jgi:outer membrane immunogenic protein
VIELRDKHIRNYSGEYALKNVIFGLVITSGFALTTPALAQSASDVTWSGPYVGVNLGYGGGDFKYNAAGSTDPAGANPASGRLRQSSNGVIGGGQIGYNHELPSGIVLGLETDIAAADIGANTSFSSVDAEGNPTATNSNSKIDYLGTVRGRVGNAMFDGRFLPYVTGGFAYGGVKSSAVGFSTPTNTQTGWTAGAGAEYALTRHLSMKAEYLYTDLGRDTIANGGEYSVGGANLYNANVSEKATANVIRVGLNYRF